MVGSSSSAGRYDVTEELGRGSMGIVCKAHDPVMGRDLAIKTILLPHGLPEEEKYEFRQRFRREAQAAGRLSHPGIVTVYDYSESEEELPYIAMEYVQGCTLHELIDREGALGAEWSLDMAEMLADALDAAHGAGVIHRDLKPANILIRETDGAAKITDFGIARVNSSDMTQAGTTYGSPAYMAPERIQGRPADARSDLFSLAVILYEALSGSRAFGGEDFTSICYAIVNEPPIPIRTRQPELSLAFDAFFRRALAKNPAERFQDGVSFRQGLESVRHQQRMFERGSETLKMLTPMTNGQIESALEPLQMIATPVPVAPASGPAVPWRWIAVGVVAMALLLTSFLLGWVFSGGGQYGQVRLPLDVNTHSAKPRPAGALASAERTLPSRAGLNARAEQPVQEPQPVEVVAPSEPTPVTEPPVVVVEPKPAPVEPPPTQTPEPEVLTETAPTPEPAAMPVEEPIADELETTEMPAEAEMTAAPVATVVGPVSVAVQLKSSFKEGNLRLLVDGEELQTLPFDKSTQQLETRIEILPGHHTLTAVAYNAAKDREYEASVDFDLEIGDMRTLQIVAGKTLGKRLSLKLN